MTPAVWFLTWISMSPSSAGLASHGLGTRPGREHREFAVGLLAPRGCDHVQDDPDDEHQHAHSTQRPADDPDGNAPDLAPERACRRGCGVAVLNGVTDALDKAEVG